MFGNSKQLPITLALRRLSTGYDRSIHGRWSDKNVYLNMQIAFSSAARHDRTIEILKGLG